MPTRRSRSFTVKKKKIFLSNLSRTGNITIAARVACVSRTWIYRKKWEDPKFDEKWEDAIVAATDLELEEARRRANVGVLKPVFYQGEECGQIREYSDSLLMFRIKGKRPEYATERKELTGKDGGPIETNTQIHIHFVDPIGDEKRE